MSQPKVALCYSGLLRSWQQCKGNHYDNVWMPNKGNLDAYFYTDDYPAEHFEEREKEFFGFLPYIGLRFTQDQNVDWYPDPFKPHLYDKNKAPENTIYQTFRQWHCGMIGFNLIPKGYDIYVRIRPDTVFNGKINFADFDCSGKKIYIPQGNDFGGVNDMFAFGNHEVMKIYYSVYQNCHELFVEGHKFHSEGMQLANLNKHGVEIIRYGAPQINIVR